MLGLSCLLSRSVGVSQTTKKIEIDLEVSAEIESRRKSFDQSENDILREVLGIHVSATRQPGTTVIPSRDPASPPRRTGGHAFVLRGERTEAPSLKEMYVACLLELAKLEEGFLDRLARMRTKSRRIIAKDPEDLYLRSPTLAEQFAVRLIGPWWVDVNLSRSQVELRLKQACAILDLSFGPGGDLELCVPTRLTTLPRTESVLAKSAQGAMNRLNLT